MSQTFSVQVQKVYGFPDAVFAYTFELPVTVVDSSGITSGDAAQCVQEFLNSIPQVRRNDLERIIFEGTPVYILVEKDGVTLNGQAVRRICTSKRTQTLGLAYAETSDCTVHFFGKMIIVKPVVVTYN